jgi:hypothetical protein
MAGERGGARYMAEDDDAPGRRWLLLAGLALVVVVALAAGAVLLLRDGEGTGPADVAVTFTEAWMAGDGDALRTLVVDPAALDAIDPVAQLADLGATETVIALGEAEEDGDLATIGFAVDVVLGEVGTLEWGGTLPLIKGEDGWLVDWQPSALHPDLASGGRLRRSETWEPRASILGLGDQVLIGATEEILVGIEPQGLTDRAGALASLEEQLDVDPATVEARLDAPGVRPDHFVPVIQVPRPAYDAVRDIIRPIPGLRFREVVGRGGPVPGFARHTVGRYGEITAERLEQLGAPYAVGDLVGLDGLEASYERQLAGQPAVTVDVVDEEGESVTKLASWPGSPPQPLRTTLDPVLQQAADAAVAPIGAPAALVAVDAASGEVRAIAVGPADDAFNRAIDGAYPPGSTFKVITASALLADGTTPDTAVDCPATIAVDGRSFRNFEGGESGTIPFHQAFAESCNTAMIGAAQSLPDGALAAAAEPFGFGLDYSLGPRTRGGSFPPPESPVEAAASAIGQGRVTGTPLHMATVAAAVLDGTWRSPMLLPEREGAPAQEARQLPADTLDALRSLMREVVVAGTGTAADVEGLDVIGKSGTAEYGEGDPLPTHAWFIAGADGLGIAAFVEDRPAGGRDAAPVVAAFLRAVVAAR